MAIVIMNAHGCGYHTEIAQNIIHKNRMGANWGKKKRGVIGSGRLIRG